MVKARARLMREWKALMPARGSEAEALQGEFDAQLQQLRTRINALPDPRAEEEATHVAARDALIAQGEALADEADLKAAIAKAKELQRQWRDAPRVSRDVGRAQSGRFKAAMDAVFARREVENEARLVKLNAYADSAEALTRSPDPFQAAEAMKQLQSQWKSTGGVRGEAGDAVWTRFRAAADQVFERRRATLEEQQSASIAAREALIAEAEAAARDAVGDPEEFVRNLQQRWRKLKPAPRERSDALWNSFRAAIDQIRNPPALSPDELGDGQDALRFSPFAGIKTD